MIAGIAGIAGIGPLRNRTSRSSDYSNKNLSSVENPGWLFDIGDEQLPNYMEIIISHYKDPY